ncbi:unnamed protein product [Rangifer tarandus platyrhynchus]|uniref:Uncharacterized protein n=1 Tax=Rangifer tarandus platyrhynchus TaxID=3082113 RepID=A0ABN8YLY1_RANTA|nr:unnamed protein product [Rangifer tarandus platyrhynchus]
MRDKEQTLYRSLGRNRRHCNNEVSWKRNTEERQGEQRTGAAGARKESAAARHKGPLCWAPRPREDLAPRSAGPRDDARSLEGDPGIPAEYRTAWATKKHQEMSLHRKTRLQTRGGIAEGSLECPGPPGKSSLHPQVPERDPRIPQPLGTAVLTTGSLDTGTPAPLACILEMASQRSPDMTPGALGFMLAAAPPDPRQCPASAPTCALSLSQWRPCPPGSLLAWRLRLHLAQALPELLDHPVGYDHTFFNEVQGPLPS